MKSDFPSLIDSSLMASYKSCPQLCKKVYFEHWKSKQQSVHLKAGGAFAKGIEVARSKFFLDGMSQDDAIAEGLSALLHDYGDFECPPDSAKSAERMAGAFEFYFSHYPLERGTNEPIILPGGKRGIEFSFAEPLEINHPVTGDPLIYCGRLDALLEYAGSPFMVDEKTTTQLGASWSRQWDLRAQFTGYAFGCERAGVRVAGAIVRGVSILKTKYDTQQAISYRPEWQVERWYQELHIWLEQMIWAWKNDKFVHNLDHACAEYGGCQFREVCASQDETQWLETHFERRAWNPLMRTETKL